MATHRTASHVVQRALTYSDERGQARIVQAGSSVLVSCCLNGTVDDDDHSCRWSEALLNGQGENSLVKVATGRYGSYVIEPGWQKWTKHDNGANVVGRILIQFFVLKLKQLSSDIIKHPPQQLWQWNWNKNLCFGDFFLQFSDQLGLLLVVLGFELRSNFLNCLSGLPWFERNCMLSCRNWQLLPLEGAK